MKLDWFCHPLCLPAVLRLSSRVLPYPYSSSTGLSCRLETNVTKLHWDMSWELCTGSTTVLVSV